MSYCAYDLRGWQSYGLQQYSYSVRCTVLISPSAYMQYVFICSSEKYIISHFETDPKDPLLNGFFFCAPATGNPFFLLLLVLFSQFMLLNRFGNEKLMNLLCAIEWKQDDRYDNSVKPKRELKKIEKILMKSIVDCTRE